MRLVDGTLQFRHLFCSVKLFSSAHSFYSSHFTKMVARLFATSTRSALKAAKANLALNRGLATAAPAVGKVKYVFSTKLV